MKLPVELPIRFLFSLAIPILGWIFGYLANRPEASDDTESLALYAVLFPITLCFILFFLWEKSVQDAREHLSGKPINLPEDLKENDRITVLKVLPHMRDIDVTDFYIIAQKDTGERIFCYAPSTTFPNQFLFYEGAEFYRLNGKMVRQKSMVEQFQEQE